MECQITISRNMCMIGYIKQIVDIKMKKIIISITAFLLVLSLISAFIALCRCAGIKARYKVFAMNMIKAWYEATVEADPLVKKWYDSMGYFMIEGEGEAFIDGKWIVAHVGAEAERQAAAGIPITKFGEDSIGNWFSAIPGTIMISESIPYGFGTSTKLLKIV